MDENLAEAAIRSLQETANRLIAEQNNLPKNSLTLPEKGTKTISKKVSKVPSVIKSIGVGGSSIFSAEITRKPEPETAPHIELMKEDSSIQRVEDIKDDQWFTMYGNLVT